MPKQSQQNDPISLSHIVAQLEELVKLAIDCQDREVKDNISVLEINKQIQSLRMLMEQLHESFAKTLQSMNIKEKDLKELKQNVDTLPASEKRLIATLKDLESKCEKAREEMYKSLQENRQTLKEVAEDLKGEKGKSARRKDKFKGIGGKKGWLPS